MICQIDSLSCESTCIENNQYQSAGGVLPEAGEGNGEVALPVAIDVTDSRDRDNGCTSASESGGRQQELYTAAVENISRSHRGRKRRQATRDQVHPVVVVAEEFGSRSDRDILQFIADNISERSHRAANNASPKTVGEREAVGAIEIVDRISEVIGGRFDDVDLDDRRDRELARVLCNDRQIDACFLHRVDRNSGPELEQLSAGQAVNYES